MDTMVDEIQNEEVQEQSDLLTAHDRCDKCGAQAYVRVNGVSGILDFCSHHFARYEEKLRSYAFEVIDERYKLEVRRESSANA